MLQIEFESDFQGPSPYASEPVIVARVRPVRGVELEPANEQALLAGCERMRRAFPEWLTARQESEPSMVFFARTMAQWTLGALNDVRGFLHDAGAREDGGIVRLWVAFHHVPISRTALELAGGVLLRCAMNEFDPEALKPRLEALGNLCRVHHPDFQAQVLMRGARAAGIPFLHVLRNSRQWQYGWGARSRVFLESASNADGWLGATLQKSKSQTKALFTRLGIPTPPAALVEHKEQLAEAVRSVGWPCVIKPEQLGGGRGVTANINTLAQLESGFEHARRFSDRPLIVERHEQGDDHRLMLLDFKLKAVVRRQASFVTGDGTRDMTGLLADLNSTRSRNIIKSNYLRPIAVDDVLLNHLAGQGLDMASVPAAGRRVTLRSNANLSTGGMAVDVTHLIHPSTRELAEMFARTLGLAHAGLDYITTDIAKPWQEGGGFIEVNATPGLDAIIAGGRQDPVELAQAVLGTLPGRIPFRLVVLADDHVPAAALHLRRQTLAPGSAWACGELAQVGGAPLSLPARAVRAGTTALLLNHGVERALVVCGARELMRHGLPVDRADTVTVCGVERELGQAWMRTLEMHACEVHRLANWTELVAAGPLLPA